MRNKPDDACNNNVCEKLKPLSLNSLLPRYKMPQFNDIHEMKEFQKKIGFPGKSMMVPLNKLRLTQSEIRLSRSKEIAKTWTKKMKPLLVSHEDNNTYAVIDGHHRFMAALLLKKTKKIKPNKKIQVFCIKAPASILLDKANELGYNKTPHAF
jgi:hypothetical protein